MSGQTTITHRIIAIDTAADGTLQFTTQGDANDAADLDTVPPEAVVGRVVGTIPHVGRALALLKTPFGMMLLVFLGFLIIELLFLFQKRRAHMDEEEPNEQ